MSFAIDGKVGVNLVERTTDRRHALGTLVHGASGAVYVYVQASGAIADAATAAVNTTTFIATSGAGSYTNSTTGVTGVSHAFASGEYGFLRKTTNTAA